MLLSSPLDEGNEGDQIGIYTTQHRLFAVHAAAAVYCSCKNNAAPLTIPHLNHSRVKPILAPLSARPAVGTFRCYFLRHIRAISSPAGPDETLDRPVLPARVQSGP